MSKQLVSIETKPKVERGRPTIYRPEMCQVIVDEMREGASITEAVGKIDITKETLYEWIDEKSIYYKEDISYAVKIGKKLSEQWWLEQGRKNLTNKDFSATLWYMNMKNRFGWADRTELRATLEISGTVEHTIDPNLLQDWQAYLLDRSRGSVTGSSTKDDVRPIIDQ